MCRQNSKKVKDWRKRWKHRIIKAMGCSCGVCGYNKSEVALQLHHIDPTKKELSFSKLRANPMAASDQVVELNKCVLVCANCHFEIHAGISECPLPMFDERLYKDLISR